MTAKRKSLSWVLLHTTAGITVLCSLLSGLRIASLNRPGVAVFEELLPQGRVIEIHFASAVAVTLVALTYITHRTAAASNPHRSANAPTRAWQWPGWHRMIIRTGYPLLLLSLASGWLLFSGLVPDLRDWHFFAALGVFLYLLLHAGLYLVRWGSRSLWRIALPDWRRHRLVTGALLLAFTLLLAGGWLMTAERSHIRLQVHQIPLQDPLKSHIHIDGVADEPHWQAATPVSVFTDGGANFDSGATVITLRALTNGEEFYLFARWKDDSESLVHLPLIKTAQGWRVQQQGFHQFDETRYYEDKFAVLLSSSCRFGAAGTAHLGRAPLQSHPANWHGKGYHYSSDGQLHDLWHWKAVRTNDMYLADDNFIGPPDKARPGERRYTAGYQQDGKESGAYVMNWQWYRPDVIVPKRLPAHPGQLEGLQGHEVQDAEWVIPWFDYQPYSPQLDARLPEGTRMPSVMYNSNRFEGDRAHVRARGQWRDGYWHLEMARRRVTGSPLDVPITHGTCLWVSAFDRAQVAHTRHSRAIRLHLAEHARN